MFRITALALFTLTATVPVLEAQEQARFQIDANYWDPGLTGRIQVLDAGIGSEIDLEGDLGIEGEAFTDLRLTFFPSRRTKVRFTRVPLSYSGDSIVSRTIEFAGQTFTLATRVASNIELNYLRAGFAWQFLASDDGRFRVGPIVEVKAFEGDASLSAPDLPINLSVTEDFEAAFGSAGLIFDLEPSDRFHVFGEYSTLVGASEGNQTEIEAGVRFSLLSSLHAMVGVRSIEIDFEDGDDLVDFDMDGAFFGVSLRF